MNFYEDYHQFITNLEECLEDPLDTQFLNLMESTAAKIFKPQYISQLPPQAIQRPLSYICQCCKEPKEFITADLLIKHISDIASSRQQRIWNKKITKTCRCCKVPKEIESMYALARHTRNTASARINTIKRKQKQLEIQEGFEDE